jgi:hypothetical protein
MNNYECPICGVRDETAYLRCNRPDCTDGRDIEGRSIRPPYGYKTDSDPDLAGCFFLLGIFLACIGSGIAFGWGVSLLVTGVLLVVVAALSTLGKGRDTND